MYANIPPRTSSLADWTTKDILIRQSQTDLKRKLSTISLEDDPVTHQKLKIEHLELQTEEQRHLKDWYNLENNVRQMSSNDFKRSHRSTNKRIISLGEELWKENQTLRALEEKAGTHPALGPDSEGAFAAVLLKLYKDPTEHSSKRSGTIQSDFRSKAITRYEPGKDAPKGKFYCPITQAFHDRDDVKAAHIVPVHLGAEIIDYLFGPGAGLRLFSADNSLMLQSRVEKHFDLGHFVLLPVDPGESPITRWKVQITNDDAQNGDVGLGPNVALKDLQGRELIFKNDARPAARFLYYHFVVMLLRNAHYKAGNYDHYCTTLPTGKPFATMGKYFRRSMLYALARKAGDVDEAAEVLIKSASQTTFDDEDKLNEKEEGEIARRILETGVEEEEEEEGEEDDD